MVLRQAGKQSGPGGNAAGDGGISAGKGYALPGQMIQPRRLHHRMAQLGEAIAAHLIHDNQYDIGLHSVQSFLFSLL